MGFTTRAAVRLLAASLWTSAAAATAIKAAAVRQPALPRAHPAPVRVGGFGIDPLVTQALRIFTWDGVSDHGSDHGGQFFQASPAVPAALIARSRQIQLFIPFLWSPR
jgi:hypothetical protein